jgi:hypothetical protein
MLSITIFEMQRQLEHAIREYHSQQFKDLKQIMASLFSIQYRLDVPHAEDVWADILRDRMEQWEQMFVSETD